MVRLVKQLDELTVAEKRAWNPDCLAEAPRNAAGDCRLPVARLAVEEEPRPRIDGRTQLIEQVGGDRDVAERLVKLPSRRRFGTDGLGIHAQDVLLQRHGNRPDVAGRLHHRLRVAAALIRQGEVVVVQLRLPAVYDDLPRTERIEELFDDVVGQAELLRDTPTARRADLLQVLQHERFDDDGVDTRLGKRPRLGW